MDSHFAKIIWKISNYFANIFQHNPKFYDIIQYFTTVRQCRRMSVNVEVACGKASKNPFGIPKVTNILE